MVQGETDAATRGAVLKGVTFELSGEEFVLDIASVEQVTRVISPTKLPHMPPWVLGVINLRGKVVPVISLHKRFELSEAQEPKRFIICTRGDRRLGLQVELVTDLVRIPVERIVPPPPVVAGIDARFISGVARVEERLLLIVNPDSLFEAPGGESTLDSGE